VASVPEVVPDEYALLHEQRAVEMRGRVPCRRREGHEQQGADAGEAAREQGFAAGGDDADEGGGQSFARSLPL
jgi:hypothetical protein